MDKERTVQILYNDGQCDFSDGHWKSQVNPPHYRQEFLQILQPVRRGNQPKVLQIDQPFILKIHLLDLQSVHPRVQQTLPCHHWHPRCLKFLLYHHNHHHHQPVNPAGLQAMHHPKYHFHTIQSTNQISD